MKKFLILILLWIPTVGIAEEKGVAGLEAHNIRDLRTSLDLSPRIKHRLLSNMQAQMAATQTIIGLIAEARYEKAAKIARGRFEMNEVLNQIYDASKNEDFNNMGKSFRASAAELANTLQTKDLKKSLLALRKTMSYCVQCHSKFRL